MSAEVDRVRAQNERFYDAVNRRNLVTMEKIWAHSAYVRCIHPGAPLLVGWPSVRESWRGLFERALVLRSRSEDLQVTVIGPTALVTCHETTSAFTSEGSTLSNAETTNIFEKLNGDWYLIHHQASPLSKAGDGFWIDFL